MMGSVDVEEKDDSFILKNNDFEIALNQRGFVEQWDIRGFDENILYKPSFVLDIGNLDEPYINPLSSVVSFEFDTNFGEIKRVFTVKEKAIVIDDVLVSNNSCQVNYKLILYFKNFDYFMIGKDRFGVDKGVERKVKDLLLVKEESDLYIGFIFKEEMDLVFKKEEALIFELSKTVDLGVSDMFLLSFTFTRV